MNKCWLFFKIKSEAKVIKMSVLYCLPVEKLNVLLKFFLPYTHLIICQKCMDSGIQNTVKSNEFSWLCVEMASIMVSWHTFCKLVKVLSTEDKLNLKQCCTQSCLGITVHISRVLEWDWRPSTMVGNSVKNLFRK